MYSFISSVRKHKKHLVVKLKKQKPNAMIGFPERGDFIWRIG